jgi:hypothetical protein
MENVQRVFNDIYYSIVSIISKSEKRTILTFAQGLRDTYNILP